MRSVMLALMAGAFCLSPVAAQAQTPPSDKAAQAATPLDARIAQLPAFLAGKMAASELFAPAFLASISEAQLKALSAQLVAQYGQPLRIVSTVPTGPNSATIKIEYDKSIVIAEITIESTAPNKIIGLLFKGFETKGDSLSKIDGDFGKLPGATGYLVEKISSDGQRTQIAGRNVTQSFAIASTFKLYVLAELAAQVDAGKRKWSDVVPLTNESYSSLATQGWPRGAPVTLQTLATWMISVSDNAATDTLIVLLGREAVEKRLALVGHSNPDKTLPLLTTAEAFALKTNPTIRKTFESANEGQQRALLDEKAADLTHEKVNLAGLAAGPAAIDSIEWFASPMDIAALLHNLRGISNETMLDILSVNKGVAPTSSAKWAYLGYKGGSEPGVISMSFLTRSKAGDYYTITGSWNNPAADVDNAVFVALMGRLLDSIAG